MEQFLRFVKLIGKEKFHKLQTKKIVVVGVGGVGGYVVEALIRSGLINITVIDYDTIDITNLNRQIITDHSNIGMLKTDAILKRAKLINPKSELITKNTFLNENNVNNLIDDDTDYVIDACDNVNAKKCIIKTCLSKKIKFISCMGTGNKFNPQLLEITELKKTNYDKLAKVMRKWANDEHLKGKIMVVSSTERCVKSDDSTIIGSTRFVPSVAGMLCASYIINDILKEG